MSQNQVRTYDRASSVVFLKTNERFGGLSNMAGGYPLLVNEVRILTSEALYQACRFPHLPDVQKLIIGEKSPMTAKMKSKPHRQDSRPDWDRVRVKVMRWCLRVKLAQNWRKFSELLLETGEQSIVEESRKDDFWGAKLVNDRTLVGMNVLGRLLMELREVVKAEGRDSLLRVEPLAIPDFLLGGRPIAMVAAPDAELADTTAQPVPYVASGDVGSRTLAQQSLFDAPVVNETPPPVYLDVREKVVGVADLKPYLEYQKSGLPWLGRVPSGWRVVRNGSLFGQRNETGYAGLSILEVSLRTGVRVRDFENSTRKQVMTDAGKYKRAARGDVAYNMMRMWQGAVGVAPVDGLVSPAYVVARPFPEVEPRFFVALFRTDDYMAEVDNCSRGIVKDRNRLYWDQFKQILSPCPPRPEQVAIVRFLDWANGRLERAIRAKRRVIALLNEQKQAIIHRAVTRGLDPSVPLKPSGIPWLEDIPKHWEMRRVKHCVSRIEQGWSPQCDAQPAGENEWGVLKVGCVNRDTFLPQQNKKLPASLHPDRSLEVQHGDILVSRANTRELLGLAALAENPPARRILCDKLFRFRANADCFNSKFLVLTLRAKPCRVQIESSTNGASSSMQNIGQGVLKNLWISMPPVAEQDRIVAHIVVATQPLTGTVSRLEREIELLREYRTRLIADVVTGKLDVREAAARLPHEPSPDIAEDDADLSDEIEPSDEEVAA